MNDDEEPNLDVGLHRDQVRHAEEARVDRSGVLDLEGGCDRVALEPEHVYQFDGPVRRIIELLRQFLPHSIHRTKDVARERDPYRDEGGEG